MRAEWILILGAVLLAAGAGAVGDIDGDLVPDQFDNCVELANGPNQASNQVDSDMDGYGNACDPDLDDDFLVGTADLALLAQSFGGTVPPEPGEADLTGDAVVGMPDILVWRRSLGGSPGPSGLACAGMIPCLP